MDLTTEQRAIRDTVRKFAREEVRPTAQEADETETFPEDVWDGLADIDLTALTDPEEYGGLDVDGLTYAVVNEELAHGQLGAATANCRGASSSCTTAAVRQSTSRPPYSSGTVRAVRSIAASPSHKSSGPSLPHISTPTRQPRRCHLTARPQRQ